MNETIRHAIEILNRAGSALNLGNLSIQDQVMLGCECHRVRIALSRHLIKDGADPRDFLVLKDVTA